MSIKIRLLELNKRQVDLLHELRKRGCIIQPSELSAFICGKLTTAKAETVLAMCEDILKEWEYNAKNENAESAVLKK